MLDLWVKIPISLTNELPISRPYSPIEARFSLEVDNLLSGKKSVREYAKTWSWNSTKVFRFIKEFDAQNDGSDTIKNNQNDETKVEQNQNKSETPKAINNSELHDDLKQKRNKNETNVKHILIREREERKEGSPSGVAKVLFDSWNEIATGTPLPNVKALSPKREKKCHIRLKERSAEEWRNIFRTISTTPFLCGQNDRGWKADFDWIISSEDPAIKILEGKYTDTRSRSDESRYSMFAGA